ncbi:hypothetical protein EDB86DRAFT_3244285 [Lactarius hatsudake]|nr:hypothetical protein EDB86DRAFT_3244285 [Lactarius hatsudake]
MIEFGTIGSGRKVQYSKLKPWVGLSTPTGNVAQGYAARWRCLARALPGSQELAMTTTIWMLSMGHSTRSEDVPNRAYAAGDSGPEPRCEGKYELKYTPGVGVVWDSVHVVVAIGGLGPVRTPTH